MATPNRTDLDRPADEINPLSRPAGTPPPFKVRRSKASPQVWKGEAGRVDLVLAGNELTADADYVLALHQLESSGIIRVTTAVDPGEGHASQLLAAFPQAELKSSLDAVTSPPGALVVLATPPRFHPAQASAAVKRGWHVLSATPLAASVREARAMIATAERNERMLAVDLQWRFYPAAQFLRSLCHDQLLGPLFRFNLHDGTPPVARTAAPTPPHRPETPDGVLLDLGAPAIDFLNWCLGSGSLVSYADDAMGGVEATAHLELRYAEGIRGTLHLSRAWPTSQTCQFVFERGIVRWSVRHANQLTLQLASASAAIEGTMIHPLGVDDLAGGPASLATRPQAIAMQLRHVLNAIAGRESLRVTAEESLKTLALVEECHARRALIEQPWLSHNETARARALSAPTGIIRP